MLDLKKIKNLIHLFKKKKKKQEVCTLFFLTLIHWFNIVSVCISVIFLFLLQSQVIATTPGLCPHWKQCRDISWNYLYYQEKQKHSQKSISIIQHMSHWLKRFQMATSNSNRSLNWKYLEEMVKEKETGMSVQLANHLYMSINHMGNNRETHTVSYSWQCLPSHYC